MFAASLVAQKPERTQVSPAVKMELASVLAVEEQEKDLGKALQLYGEAVKDQKLSEGARQYAAYRLAALLRRLGRHEEATAVLRAAGKGKVVSLDDVTNGQDPERQKQLRLQARELIKKLTTRPIVGTVGHIDDTLIEQLTWIGRPAVPEVVAYLQDDKNRTVSRQIYAQELYGFLWRQGGPHASKHLCEVATQKDANYAQSAAGSLTSIDIHAPEVRAYVANENPEIAKQFLQSVSSLLDAAQLLALADGGDASTKSFVLRTLPRRTLNQDHLKHALALCEEARQGANPEYGKASELFLTSTEAQQSIAGMLMLLEIVPDLYRRRVPVASYQAVPRGPNGPDYEGFKPRQFSNAEMAAILPALRAATKSIGAVEGKGGPTNWLVSLIHAFLQSGSEAAIHLAIEMWDLGYGVHAIFGGFATPATAVELLKRWDKVPQQSRDRFFWAFGRDDMTPAAFPLLCEIAASPAIGSNIDRVIQMVGHSGHEDAADWVAAQWRKGAVDRSNAKKNTVYVDALVQLGRTDKGERVRIAMQNMARGFGGPRLDGDLRAQLMLALMSMGDERVLDFLAVGLHDGKAVHPYCDPERKFSQSPLQYLTRRQPDPAHGYSTEQILDTVTRLVRFEKRGSITTRNLFSNSVRDDVLVILATEATKYGEPKAWATALTGRLDERLRKGGDVAILEKCFLGGFGRASQSEQWLSSGVQAVWKRYRKQIRALIDGDDGDWAMKAITCLLHFEDERFDVAELLRNRHEQVREWAVREVANGSAKVPAAQVIPLLRDSSVRTRQQAALHLGAVVAKTAVPALIELLRDSDHDVRKQAADALTRIRFYHEQQAHWDRVLKGLDASPASAAEKLLVQAKPGANKEQRLLAIKSLGVLGAPEALPFLIEWSQEKDPEISATSKAAITEIHLKPGK